MPKKEKIRPRCRIPLKRSFRAHVGAPIRRKNVAQMPDTLEKKFQGPRGAPIRRKKCGSDARYP